MNDNPTPAEAIRKSLLPCTPPAEWEFSSVLGAPHGCLLFPSDGGPVVVRRRVTYGDWEPVRPDHWADEPPTDAVPAAGLVAVPPTPVCKFDEGCHRVVPCDPGCGTPSPATDRTALRDRIRRAICEASGFEFDDDGIEPDEYGEHADAVLGVLPPPADRATVLREAADHLNAKGKPTCEPDGDCCWYDAVSELRRLAAETQPSEPEAVRHAPGTAILCPDCHAKGHSVCMADACGPAPDQCDADGEPCTNHEREQAHAEGEHAFCGAECAETEPTAEETARNHVFALHQIGEQLAGIESWMWEHLADVRAAAAVSAVGQTDTEADRG